MWRGPIARTIAGVFGLFRKKPRASPVREGQDRVYVDADAVADAVAADIARVAAAGRRAGIVTPFRADVADVASRLARRGLVTAPVERSTRDAAPPGAVPIADYASLSRLLAELPAPIELIQVERHPLRARDAAVEQALEAHSRDDRLRVYLALDGGVLAMFAGSTRELMEKLGIAPGEAIEHPWVSASIENAQAKIAKKATGDEPADSLAAWKARNVRG